MKISFISSIILAILLVGCAESNTKNHTPDIYNANGIRVYEKTSTDDFPSAQLSLVTQDSNIAVGQNTFNYKVDAYDLKDQSPSAKTNGLANSGKGQHIHFIVDNGPYQAKYDPSFEANLDTGSHLVLAFLSRSFHESVKEKNAFVLKQYQLDGSSPLADINEDPLLFYSRPKGSYKLADGHKVLLDFYLINTDLSENGNKVKVQIDNEHFTVAKWQPYIIEGLTAGEHTVQIELVDHQGKPIPGPFNNSGKRIFTICLLYTSPSPRDQRGSRMPSSA